MIIKRIIRITIYLTTVTGVLTAYAGDDLIQQAYKIPEKHLPNYGESIIEAENWAKKNLGVGYLAPKERELSGGSLDGADWLQHIVLPLYDKPEGSEFGLLANGWFINRSDNSNKLLGTSAMLETAYESLSLIVNEYRDDGWFEVSYALPTKNRTGLGWSHLSLVAKNSSSLTIVLWQDFFLRGGKQDHLYYRNNHKPHAMRDVAGTEGNLITWIGESHSIKPIKVRGDWMFVHVQQPSCYCADSGCQAKEYKGWIKWRDNTIGTWLWLYSRGC